MQSFGYEHPEWLGQAVDLLRTHRPHARPLAGGTDLVNRLRDGTLRPHVVVDLKGIAELRPGITQADGRLWISATTVLADLVADERMRTHFPALVTAAGVVGPVQIRNRATLAGNICNASPAADTAPPLLVYRAQVIARGPAGTRSIPIDAFFLGPGKTTLARDELVTAIELPVRDRPVQAAFGRLTRRRGADLATVSVCVSVDGTGSTRIGYGAVGPRPLLATDDSGVLADPATDPATRTSLLARLARATSPVSDVRASQEYRRSMLLVLSQRVLRAAVIGEGEG